MRQRGHEVPPAGAAPQATPCLARVGGVGPGRGGRVSQCSPPAPPWPPEARERFLSLFCQAFFLSRFTLRRERKKRRWGATARRNGARSSPPNAPAGHAPRLGVLLRSTERALERQP